ncbi:MAG: transcriptional regulator, partial [Actinobacteria bacterium]|nr:transcriptional regulator [Actinomycetota bacterium]
MNISAETDYAIRAMLYLSSIYRIDDQKLATTEEISNNQVIPHKFLETILRSLKKGELIEGHRGNQGGYKL